MKPLDSNEFFNSNEKKEFGEFKPFKAEQYYPLETKNDVKEVGTVEVLISFIFICIFTDIFQPLLRYYIYIKEIV